MGDAPEIHHLQSQDHIGLTDCRAIAAIGLIERMARGKIHPRGEIHNPALQKLGELHKMVHGLLIAAVGIRDDDRVLRGDQKLRGFRDRSRFPLGHGDDGKFRDLKL
ncbi:MAG: hypothetical protein QOF03_558 [Alphaproteobacteria bacterium]|nr:hypothetical protein [Alphaproteobacteria bacterium]